MLKDLVRLFDVFSISSLFRKPTLATAANLVENSFPRGLPAQQHDLLYSAVALAHDSSLKGIGELIKQRLEWTAVSAFWSGGEVPLVSHTLIKYYTPPSTDFKPSNVGEALLKAGVAYCHANDPSRNVIRPMIFDRRTGMPTSAHPVPSKMK